MPCAPTSTTNSASSSGTLREEGLLDNTILLFTSDHGDMLGKHGLWAKRLFYEESAQVPMILCGTAAQAEAQVGFGRVDDRLVGWQDVMPTLLELAGVDIPEHVQGMSMVGATRRQTLYGEVGEATRATRMLHDGRHKLIYYPVGNRLQLFDLESDPQELTDLSEAQDSAPVRRRLEQALMAELYGSDREWVKDGELVGLPDAEVSPQSNRGLSGQRGMH
jgi:arylsulfatase A-like enzyme